jgi:hypothetical protein
MAPSRRFDALKVVQEAPSAHGTQPTPPPQIPLSYEAPNAGATRGTLTACDSEKDDDDDIDDDEVEVEVVVESDSGSDKTLTTRQQQPCCTFPKRDTVGDGDGRGGDQEVAEYGSGDNDDDSDDSESEDSVEYTDASDDDSD